MEQEKQRILKSLVERGCIDSEIYYIIDSLPHPKEQTRFSDYAESLYSLVTSGLTTDQAIRITAARLVLLKEFDDADVDYVGLFNENYKKLKKISERL